MAAVIYLLFGIAATYQLIALFACLRFLSRRSTDARAPGSVSVLKPAHSNDPGFLEAIRTHLAQRGPEFELLIGARNVTLFENLPKAVRTVTVTTSAANGKVGALVDLVRASRHEILVINDADIRVPADYLARVTAPLADPRIGLVTCLYRAHGTSFAARIEALGVATDFAPSALVAPLVGVDEFAFGSTLAFSKADLAKIGGFEAIGDYIADDYQLGKRLHALGLKCVLSEVVVDTGLGGAARGWAAWAEVWKHQVRWARTIRVSRFGGYVGLPVTFATVWAIVIAALGYPAIGFGLLALRFLTAASGTLALRDIASAKLLPLIPLRDLFGAVVWIAGLFGTHVEWRGQRLRLDRDGRIVSR